MFYTPFSRSIFAPPVYPKKPPPAAADQPPPPQADDGENAAHAEPRYTPGEARPPQGMTGDAIPPSTITNGAREGRVVKLSTDGSPEDPSQRDRLRRLAELGKAGIKTAINGNGPRQVPPGGPPATTAATPRLEKGTPHGAGAPPGPVPAASPPSSGSPAASPKQENTTGQPPQPPTTTTQQATAAPTPSAPAAAPAPQGQPQPPSVPAKPPPQSQVPVKSGTTAASSTAPDATEYDPKAVAAVKQAEAEGNRQQQREAGLAAMEAAGMGEHARSLRELHADWASRRAAAEKNTGPALRSTTLR
jgi:hypothetical protein